MTVTPDQIILGGKIKIHNRSSFSLVKNCSHDCPYFFLIKSLSEGKSKFITGLSEKTFSQTVKAMGLEICFNNLVSFWLLCPLSQTCTAKADLSIWYSLLFLMTSFDLTSTQHCEQSGQLLNFNSNPGLESQFYVLTTCYP